MSNAYTFQQRLGKHGLFYNQFDSQTFVTSGEFTPDVTADYYVIKYGGDWGGLWGNPDTWGKLSPKGGNTHRIVPMIYVKPEHWSKYRDIVGGLFAMGYPSVFLDVEDEWKGNESILYSLLTSLNVDDNAIAVIGYGWFNGWDNDGKAFKGVINALNVVYIPMVYMSDWANETEGIAQVTHDLSEITRVIVPAFDPEGIGSVDNKLFGNTFAFVPSALLWCRETVSMDEIQTFLSTLTVADIAQPDTRSTTEKVNASLGQGIEYVNQLLQFREGMTQQQIDLVTAISDTMHNARKTNGGE